MLLEFGLSLLHIPEVDSMIDPDNRKIFSCYRPDNQTIYQTIPNNTNCEPIDSRGFRIHPGSYNSSESVVVLGDSFVYGNYVDSDQSIPAFLQKMFINNNEHIQVINAGVPGFGTDQQYIHFLDNVLPITRPKILFWIFHENDWDVNEFGCLFRIEKEKLVRVPATYNSVYWYAKISPFLPKQIYFSNIFRLIKHAIPDNFTFGCSSRRKLTVSELNIKKAKYIHAIRDVGKIQGFFTIFIFIQSQYGYADIPSDEYKKQTQDKLDLFRSLSIPIVVVTDFIKTMLVEKNSIQTDNDNRSLDISLFAKNDLGEYGEKHMNKLGNELIAKILYEQYIIMR